ncbi:thioredoxin fold domain-containing protein [Arcobacter sp. LA11]|uniref:thioredoxin fold domain-containing protein n=1 Tax=Arcobacter sp. LA11 TaxID=1898176 RepID=UPI0009353F8F|nr:thioredoxin fold domain-containing protein [Arcobacter sp. LA11]
MTKIIRNVLLLIAMISSLNAAQSISSNEIKEIQNLELFKKAKVDVQQGFDAGSVYVLNVTVQGRSDKIFLTKDKKYLIAGDVISTKTGQPLEVPADLKPTLGKEAFTFGTGKDEYVLFTDPECPYCKKFEEHFPKIEDKVKIRVFYFPLDFHKNAKDISLYVMSQKNYKDKVNAMINTTKDTPAFKNKKYAKGEKEKLQKHLDSQLEVAKKLGIRGTPSVYDKDGNKVVWAAMLQKYGVKVQ